MGGEEGGSEGGGFNKKEGQQVGKEGDWGGLGGLWSILYLISACAGQAHKASELITEAIWIPHDLHQSWEQ